MGDFKTLQEEMKKLQKCISFRRRRTLRLRTLT